MRKLTTQDFIDRARAVHGDKYGYAFSVYQSAHEKVMIHCPEHGVFEQSPANHLFGLGCNSCAIDSRAKKKNREPGLKSLHLPLSRYMVILTVMKMLNTKTKTKK